MLFGNERYIPSLTHRPGTTLIHDDSEQPAAKPVPFAITPQVSVGAQERVLYSILGVVGVSQQVRRDPQAARMMPVDEMRKGLHVALEDGANDHGIGWRVGDGFRRVHTQ